MRCGDGRAERTGHHVARVVMRREGCGTPSQALPPPLRVRIRVRNPRKPQLVYLLFFSRVRGSGFGRPLRGGRRKTPRMSHPRTSSSRRPRQGKGRWRSASIDPCPSLTAELPAGAPLLPTAPVDLAPVRDIDNQKVSRTRCASKTGGCLVLAHRADGGSNEGSRDPSNSPPLDLFVICHLSHYFSDVVAKNNGAPNPNPPSARRPRQGKGRWSSTPHRPLSQSFFQLDRRVNCAIRERGLRNPLRESLRPRSR